MSMPEPARLGRHEDWAGDDDESDCATNRCSFFMQFWCVQLKLGAHKRLNSFYISPYLGTVKSL